MSIDNLMSIRVVKPVPKVGANHILTTLDVELPKFKTWTDVQGSCCCVPLSVILAAVDCVDDLRGPNAKITFAVATPDFSTVEGFITQRRQDMIRKNGEDHHDNAELITQSALNDLLYQQGVEALVRPTVDESLADSLIDRDDETDDQEPVDVVEAHHEQTDEEEL